MKQTLEKSIFQYTLVLAIIYQAYQIVNGLLSGAATTLLNFGITLCLIIVLLLSRKFRDINYLAFFLHVAVLPVLVYFWKEFGGLSGTVPLVLFAYSAVIILSLRGWLQIATLTTYLLVFIFLTEFPSITGIIVAEHGKLSTLQLSVDFIVVAILITISLLYLKNKFVTYRKRIKHRHTQLQLISVKVNQQADELRCNQEEIKLINDNLENIIDERIRNIESRNAELEEYAFINAHLVRGPLCRIMGLSNIILQEKQDPHLEVIHKKAQRVDVITRRINEIISK